MAKNERKMLLIVNPCAGRMTIKHHLLAIVNVFSAAGFAVTVYPTKAKGDAENKALNEASKYHSVVCCGGDGTLNEVINGIIRSNANVPLGYIPCGTLNEWSLGLGVAKNAVSAASDIVAQNLISLDVGDFAGRYFSYTASFGAFTEASYTASQDIKNVLGQAAYIIEGVKSLTNIKPIHLEFSASEKTVSGNFLFGAISNSMSVGGIVKYNQSIVALNDGEFEVLLVHHPKNASQMQSIITAVLTRNFDNKFIEFFHTKSLKISGAAGVRWTLDGEMAISENEFTVNNLHNALTFYAPSRFLKK